MTCLAEINLDWPWTAVLRLLVAAVLGAVIGVEREYHGRSAGFRTQLLVALGSALAMVVSLQFARTNYHDWPAGSAIQVDPARVAYGVMTGIGFLGAGAIIREGPRIQGLTTAAGLWCTAALGLACGLGMYTVAVIAAGLVIFALFILSRLDRHIPSETTRQIRLALPTDIQDQIGRIRGLLADRGARILRVDYRRDCRRKAQTITFHVSMRAGVGAEDLRGICDDLPELLHLDIR